MVCSRKFYGLKRQAILIFLLYITPKISKYISRQRQLSHQKEYIYLFFIIDSNLNFFDIKIGTIILRYMTHHEYVTASVCCLNKERRQILHKLVCSLDAFVGFCSVVHKVKISSYLQFFMDKTKDYRMNTGLTFFIKIQFS